MLDALKEAKSLDRIYVSTNCPKIIEIIKYYDQDINIFHRNEQNAQDESSSEAAVIEFLKSKNFNAKDVLLLAQATSPLTSATDIENGLMEFISTEADSLLTVVRHKHFIWSDDAVPINYSFKNRPRRQEFSGYLVENGAFYITRVGAFLESGNRLSGKIITYEMPSETFWEIDEVEDIDIVDALLKRRQKK